MSELISLEALLKPDSSGIAVAGDADDIEALLAMARAEGALAVRLELATVRGKEALLNTIGKTLRFPDWFGANWDALADCLADMGWQPAEHYLLVFVGGAALAERADDVFPTLVSILQEASAEWRDRGVAFSAVFVLPDDVAKRVASDWPQLSSSAKR